MNTEALKLLKERRSCRSYKPEQITDAELDAVLEAGTYAPTANGRQSPIIVAVQNPEAIAQLRRMNAGIMGNPEADPFYGAPTVLVVRSPPPRRWAWAPAGSTGPGRSLRATRAGLC